MTATRIPLQRIVYLGAHFVWHNFHGAVSQKLFQMEAEKGEKILHTHVDIAKTLKIAKSTVYDVLKRFRERKSMVRVPQGVENRQSKPCSTVRRIRSRAGYRSYQQATKQNV